MKTIVYVDGFNLYYGALKGTPYKWLDLQKLCQLLLPNPNEPEPKSSSSGRKSLLKKQEVHGLGPKNQIVSIKYFTAKVSARPHDPNQPTRQQTYLRALQTLPNLQIIFGHFLSHEILMPPASTPTQLVKVIKTEEKGSDVNIAAHLVNDGHKKLFDVAVLVTNDSDLLEPLKIVRYELNLPVGVLNPQKKASRVLARHASFIKKIRQGVLRASQFPDTLQDKKGKFRKPTRW